MKRRILFVWLLLFFWHLPLQAQTYLDTIIFGNQSSEAEHSFIGPNTIIITNNVVSPAQTARQCLTNNPVTIYGGSLTFQLRIDPVWRNYFTVKLWGGDDYSTVYQQDANMGRLYLYVPASNYIAGATNYYQVGYRHEGDYDPLNTAAYKPPLWGRFFYSTTLLPLWMTQGRTNLTLTIQPGGRIYDLGSGGPPSGDYQFNMITNSRSIYQAYTHTDPDLNPVGEAQGAPPATTIRPSPTVSTMLSGGAFYNGLTNYLYGRLTTSVTNFTTTDVMQLAKAYWVSNLPATFTNPAIVSKVIAANDYFASNYFANPNTAVSAGSDEGWGGRFGNLGWAIDLLLPELQTSVGVTLNYGAGGNMTRSQAWGTMLQASRDYGRTNRDDWDLSNQGLISDTSIYWANRGMLDLTNVNAFPETNAQQYLLQAIGIVPWLGSDLPNGGHSYLHGTNYFQVTSNGLTREWGYVGMSYGEMQFYAADFYSWTTNTVFLTQCVKMVKARVNFRRPSVDINGNSYYQCMEGIGLLAWRGADESDSQYADELGYGDHVGWAQGMRCAAVTMDTNVIGYAKQMLNDNEYFNALTLNSSYYYSIGGLDSRDALNAFTDYQTVANAPDSGVRLPMTSGQPDFAWADPDSGVVVVKHNNEKLWLSTYWEAGSGTGVNGIGRFLYETNNFDRYGDLEVSPQFTFSGSFYYRPNMVDLPYKTVYQPPDNPTNAYTRECLPLAASDSLATDNQPFCGKALFWTCQYGNYLIGINRSAGNTYQLQTPIGFVSATNLMTGQNMTAPVYVAPESAVILYLNSPTNSNPVPLAPLSLDAIGSGSPAGVALNWSAASGATGYNVKRATVSGGPYTIIANVTGTNYTDTNVTAGDAYYYVVSGTNTYGESDYNSMQNFASAGLPPPWQNQDIGTTGLPGNSSYAAGTFTVNGAGSDIGSTADSFQFVYQSLTNNGTIIARLATMEPGGTLDKAGVMMRESTNTGAMAAVIMFDITSGFHDARFATRTADNSDMIYNWNGPYITGAPVWLELQRTSLTNYIGYYSSDGLTWTPVGTNSFPMNGTVLVGPAVCSRITSELDTSTFDNVTLPGWPGLPGIPNNLSIQAGSSQVMLSWATATNATGYDVQNSTVSGGPYTVIITNTPDLSCTNTGLNNGTRYYYVVSSLNEAGQSANSAEVNALPVSSTSPMMSFGTVNGQIQLSWPLDHTGWELQEQTNGLSANWVTVTNSSATNVLTIPIGITNDSVFFRLTYP